MSIQKGSIGCFDGRILQQQCRFKSMEDAIADMERQKEEGKIIRYFEVT